ncbi:hypothetical protein LUZ60_016130 [Juncus effusus]|nr:hypothetical protein LUZ60_016130 [Juncus effusus]
MKLVWCPQTASKAYMDGVQPLTLQNHHEDNSIAEFISAMAAGWNAQLIIDAQANEINTAITLGLINSAQHTHGRYVRVSPDKQPMEKTSNILEQESDDLTNELKGVDFLVVDGRRKDIESVIKQARPGPRGMVVIKININMANNRHINRVSSAVTGAGMRVVRSVFLPIGKGVEIVHVGVGKGSSLGKRGSSRWIRHVDRDTGEEHFFRR